MHSPGKGCHALASDEPTNHSLRQPEQCMQHISPGAVQRAPDVPITRSLIDQGRPRLVLTCLFELQGQHYLLLVDYCSNFFELARFGPNTRATCVIDAMRSQLARHGSAEVLVSDNGPQFSCREFRTFTQLWYIEHATSSPRCPQNNGQAVRAIGTVKNLMKNEESFGRWKRNPLGIAEL